MRRGPRMHRNMESILSGCPNNMAPAIVPFYFEHDLSIRFVLIPQYAAIEISILLSHPNLFEAHVECTWTLSNATVSWVGT